MLNKDFAGIGLSSEEDRVGQTVAIKNLCESLVILPERAGVMKVYRRTVLLKESVDERTILEDLLHPGVYDRGQRRISD